MSLRLRKSGALVCGAKSEPEDGDTYIDDRLAYALSLHGAVEPEPDEQATGRWKWRKHAPYWEDRP
jgi:hypothetical protein